MTSGTLASPAPPQSAAADAPTHAELIAVGLGLAAMYTPTYLQLNATL